jgi:transcriptional regulator with XRE-family HTH domain
MHRVKELREAKGISVRHLALATGFSHSTIARLERGERKLSTPQAIALADYFGVSVDFLLGKSPEEMFNDFVDSLRGDFMTELLHGDGDVTQSLSDSVREPVRTKLEILFLLRDINSKDSLDMILNLAKLRSAKADFGGED